MSTMTRVTVSALALALVSVAAVPADEEATSVLEAVVEVEASMLEDARGRYAALTRRQVDLTSEIELLRDALEDAVGERDAPDHRRIQQLADQLERAESERAGLWVTERLIVDRIARHLQRLDALRERVDGIRAATDDDEGVLSGSWDLVLMPEGQRGTASLRQTGALVNGTYRLEGGWKGNLQGTLVNRKVFLVRIDSKLGKSMELEGYLSADGDRIRGSWLNYELAGGDGATGQWTAQRRAVDSP